MSRLAEEDVMKNRIDVLRLRAREYDNGIQKFLLKFYERYKYNINDPYETYAEAFAYAMDSLDPVIDEGELIVGKPDNSKEYRDAWALRYKQLAEDGGIPTLVGRDSHMAIDYELLLAEGTEGIRAKIEERLAATTVQKAKKLYDAQISALLAVERFSLRYSELAASLAENAENERKTELLNIAEICKRVPRYPARSLHEAIQAVNFICLCLNHDPHRPTSHQYMLGRIDRYLLPFYLHDIKSGVLTREQAQTLIDCMGVQINNRVPNGLSCGYMVGGRYPDGRVCANDLTMMGIQSVDNVRLIYPAVGFCYCNDMPKKYLQKACEVLSHGHSHPAIFNDDLISEGLRMYGVPHEESVNYIHSTCVEITPIASSYVWVASPYTNMLELLLKCLDREYSSFDELMACYFELLDKSIAENCEREISNRKRRQKETVEPLLSCFVNDCIERGLDMNDGGARYNWVMPSFVGIGNLVDSLFVIKKSVFDEKYITLAEIKVACDTNFEANEPLRQRFLNRYPKYGNDCDEVDLIYPLITEHIVEECKKYTTHFDSRLIPSVFCWQMHDRFGRATGATPDGRTANMPLGDGSGPCQGRELKGPTASVLSTTKWSHKEFVGGVALNMKFSKSQIGESSIDNMCSLIKTYMDRGGFEIQINVVDSEMLKKARKNPSEYSDLMVRIGGYSDYFVKLSRSMQEELVLRTEHNI